MEDKNITKPFKIKVKEFPNSVEVRNKNRQLTIVNPIDDLTPDENGNYKLMENKNFIHFKAMVSEVGSEPGVRHVVTHKGKVKQSSICLSDDALKNLYYELHRYFMNKREKINE